MESEVTTCSICSHSYDEKERRPLVLLCSHSFCQFCLRQMETARKKNCPNCRRYWGEKNVTDLLSCFQLIPATPQTVQKNQCHEHSLVLSCWCDTCHCSACIRCVEKTHRKCEWSSVYQKKENVKLEGDELVSKLTEKLEKSETLLSSFIDTLLNKQKKLCDWQAKVRAELASYEDRSNSTPGQSFSTKIDELTRILASMTELYEDNPCQSFLLRIANAYLVAGDDIEDFITHLMGDFNQRVQKGVTLEAESTSNTIDQLSREEESGPNYRPPFVKIINDETVHNSPELINLNRHTCQTYSQLQEQTQLDKVVNTQLIKRFRRFLLEMTAYASSPMVENEGKQKMSRKIDGLLASNSRPALHVAWNQLDPQLIESLPLNVTNVAIIIRCGRDEMLPPNRRQSYRHVNLVKAKSLSESDWSDHLDQCLEGYHSLFINVPQINRTFIPRIIDVLSRLTGQMKADKRIVASLLISGRCSEGGMIRDWRKDFESNAC